MNGTTIEHVISIDCNDNDDHFIALAMTRRYRTFAITAPGQYS